jgi:4-coumarate--CoA ligase
MWSIKSKEQEVLFNFSTLYWATGFIFLITGTLYGCKRVITTRTFAPELMIDIIDRFKVTTTLSPPSAIASLVHSSQMRPLKSLEHFMASGSIVSKSLCESMQPFIPNGAISTVYGTSEGDFLAVCFGFTRFGSVGKPSTNVQIRLIDEEGNNLGPNQEGEICFKTPVTFSGYLDDPEKTKESVKDDWVFSGDLGYFDDEGFLFIVDRKKDMLKFNNFQVYPSELEEIINGIDGVVNSCVVGIFEEDKGNDLIFAFVIKDLQKLELKQEDIVTYVNTKVIDAKRLRGGVHFIESLPMTPSGKILRRKVKEIAKEMYDKSH